MRTMQFYLEHTDPLEGAENSDQNLDTAVEDFYLNVLKGLKDRVGLLPEIRIDKREPDGSAWCTFTVSADNWDRAQWRIHNHADGYEHDGIDGNEWIVGLTCGYVAYGFKEV